MIIGALLQATAYARAHLIVGRIVSGLGMGWINSTVPVFQAEFSPKATRGLCTSKSHHMQENNTDIIILRRLHATLNPQPRNIPRLLDRLRLHSNLHLLLRLARPRNPPMHLPPPYAHPPLSSPRITTRKRFPTSHMPINKLTNSSGLQLMPLPPPPSKSSPVSIPTTTHPQKSPPSTL